MNFDTLRLVEVFSGSGPQSRDLAKRDRRPRPSGPLHTGAAAEENAVGEV